MLSPEPGRQAQAQELLEAADAAFDAGKLREGAWHMWEAARVSVVAVAQARGWPSATMDDLNEVIYRLDGIDPNSRYEPHHPRPARFLNFAMAGLFREQAETGEGEYPEFRWEHEDEFRSGQASVRKLIAKLSEDAAAEYQIR